MHSTGAWACTNISHPTHSELRSPTAMLHGVNTELGVVEVPWGPHRSPCQHWRVFLHNMRFLAACGGWRAQAQQVHGHPLSVSHPTHSTCVWASTTSFPPHALRPSLTHCLCYIVDEVWTLTLHPDLPVLHSTSPVSRTPPHTSHLLWALTLCGV